MQLKNLSIVVVSFNTRRLLCDCLESIQAHVSPEVRVIVVDNASMDGSLEMVRTKFPTVCALSNPENLGFAKANNTALPHCQSEYIFFLNPDTVIFDDTMQAAVAYMDREQNVGLAGARLINPDGSHQASVEKEYPRQRFDREKQLALKRLKGEIAWVKGAAMITRRDLILELGGFDEDFFLYAEETDLCLRIRQAGWAIGYIEAARVTHWGGESEKPNLPVAVWEKKYRAELRFMKKHYSAKAMLSSIRANRRQAIYRVLTLQLTIPFSRGRKRDQMVNKLDNYRCLLRVTKNPADCLA